MSDRRLMEATSRFAALDPTLWIGIPFVSHGRTREGCDCWGLVLLIAREVFEIEGPDFAYEDALDNRTLTLFRRHRDAVAVAAAQPHAGDLVLLKPAGLPVHVGTVLPGGRFLHTTPAAGSIVERLDALVWRQRIEGFWRWR